MHAPEVQELAEARTLDFVLPYMGSNPSMFHVERASATPKPDLDQIGGPAKGSQRERGPPTACVSA